LDNSNNDAIILTAALVVSMTDNDNDLVIRGNSGDTIDLSEDSDTDGNSDWSATANSSMSGFTEYIHSANGTISVFIDDDITHSGL